MRVAYSGDITRDIVATAYGIRHDRAIKISRGGVSTCCRPCSFNVRPRVPLRVQRESVSRFTCGKRTYTRIRIHICTPRSHVPRGIIGSPGVDLCHQSWSSDAISWSMACLFSTYASRRNQVLSTEMKNASGESQLLYNASRATGASIIPSCASVLITYLKYLLLTDK